MFELLESLEGRTLLSASPATDPFAGRAYHHGHHPSKHHEVVQFASLERSVSLSPMKSGKTLAKRAASSSNLLKVSSNGRFLVNASTGSPFFYMADTAWHLFNKLSRSQADQYLSTRAKQGFTVIQAEVNTRFGANVNGDTPFVDGDPMQPNEDFFQNVDYIVGRATALGMYISLVPLDTRWASRGVFDPTSAYTFGRYLGARYRSSKIIWTLGGDIGGDEVPSGLTLWRELAAGIARGAANKDLSKVLMQYHPGYNQDSSQWFNGDAWLDMNAFQSGHGQNPANYNKVAADYAKSPTRPVMDIETDYEDIPAGIQAGAPRLTDYDVRKAQYWALFAGAHGVTYGNNNVWQFVKTISTRNLATMTWQEALDSPGANSMSVLKRLMLSRPYLNRVPDQGLIVGSTLSGGDHIQATRASDGSYAFVYTAGGKPVTVNLSKLSGSKLDVRWYNPRSGRSTYVGQFDKTGNRTFNAPVAGYDWVLVIDDASRHFGKP